MTAELTEQDLRGLADLVRPLLPRLVGDPELARRLDAELAEALALPAGAAKATLRRLLTRTDSTLRRWFGERIGLTEHDRAPERRRSLVLRVPPTARLGESFGIQVRIGTPIAGESWGSLGVDDVPPQGIDLVVDVWSSGLAARDGSSRTLHLPAEGDSAMIRFEVRAVAPGRRTVHVTAYRDGVCVAEAVATIDVGAQFSAGAEAVSEQPPVAATSPVDLRHEDAGAFALLVKRLPENRYGFALRGPGADDPESVERSDADSVPAITRLAAELEQLAANEAAGSVGGHLHRLRSRAVGLWLDAVPESIRSQFWAARPRMTSLAIASEWARVPWELMYPMDEGHDDGFLVETVPVVRRGLPAGGSGRAFSAASAAFVVPPGSPSGADSEVERIRSRLTGAGYTYGGVFDDYDELTSVLASSPPSMLHFACHNDFSDDAGSQILLAGGQLFTPDDLGLLRASRALGGTLVFLNACRSAGEFAGWRTTTSWADRFTEAGASAFVGSLWSIRSTSAADFADAFYASLVQDGKPLGEATRLARLSIRSSGDADPTWLAYTVHGDAAARVPDVPPGGAAAGRRP